jgi:hypothetical protein
LANGEASRLPPIFRMLLGPADLRRGEGLMVRSGGSDNAAVAVNYQRARAASANVNPQYVNRAPALV